jgi:WXG100 family type VII secretion target
MGGSTKFSITGGAVNKHAGNLDSSVAGMNASLTSFINALEGLPGVWQGTAFKSFDALQKRWQAASKELNGALTDIRGRVGNAGKLYDQYHAEQASTIARANSGANWDGTKFRG